MRLEGLGTASTRQSVHLSWRRPRVIRRSEGQIAVALVLAAIRNTRASIVFPRYDIATRCLIWKLLGNTSVVFSICR